MRATVLLLLLAAVIAVSGARQSPLQPVTVVPVVVLPAGSLATPAPALVGTPAPVLHKAVVTFAGALNGDTLAPLSTEEPAIMVKTLAQAAPTLKAPRIYTPPAVVAAALDEPILGALPKNTTLKAPAAINPNIFGGVVEFENATTPMGCPCSRPIPSRHRYDAEFVNPTLAPVNITCGCMNTTNTTNELPPIIARLRREVNITIPSCNTTVINGTVVTFINGTKFVNGTTQAPIIQILPKYYKHARAQTVLAAAAAAALLPPVPCVNPNLPPVNGTIQPHYVGETKAERAARRAAWAQRQAARAARRAARAAAAAAQLKANNEALARGALFP